VNPARARSLAGRRSVSPLASARVRRPFRRRGAAEAAPSDLPLPRIDEQGSLLEWHRDRLAEEERKRVIRQRAEWLVREAGIPSHVALATAEAMA
jgi:hypothetical protein